jgi:hypothetical protein
MPLFLPQLCIVLKNYQFIITLSRGATWGEVLKYSWVSTHHQLKLCLNCCCSASILPSLQIKFSFLLIWLMIQLTIAVHYCQWEELMHLTHKIWDELKNHYVPLKKIQIACSTCSIKNIETIKPHAYVWECAMRYPPLCLYKPDSERNSVKCPYWCLRLAKFLQRDKLLLLS